MLINIPTSEDLKNLSADEAKTTITAAKNKFAAIDIGVSGVTLKINQIIGTCTAWDDPSTYYGIGVTFSGQCNRCDIDIFNLAYLYKGIEVYPRYSRNEKASWVQYTQIRFKLIRAFYCFYVDIFSDTYVPESTNSDNLCAPNKLAQYVNWFSESQVYGGQLAGHHGIYFEEPGEIYCNTGNYGSMNGLYFDNIGLENLTGIPVRLRNLSFCSFLNLRMMEGLPGLDLENKNTWDSDLEWFDMQDIVDVNISVKGYVRPNHYKASGRCTNVVVRGNVVDDEGWYINHFDTMVFMPIWNPNIKDMENKVVGGFETKMVATSSIQPYNMAKLLLANDVVPNSGGTATKTFYLRDVLPHNNTSIVYPNQTAERKSQFDVLPRTINVIVADDNEMILDLTGLSQFAPSVIDVCAMVTPGGWLTFRVDQFPSSMTILPEGIRNRKEYTFNENGLYRLTWDDKWVLQISRIVT